MICGKCGSGNVYRDYVAGIGDAGLACQKCGNRGMYGFKIGEDNMGRIRGTCSNCKRTELMVAPPKNLCASCQAGVIGIKDEAARLDLLAKKAAHFAEQGVGGRRKYVKKIKDIRPAMEAVANELSTPSLPSHQLTLKQEIMAAYQAKIEKLEAARDAVLKAIDDICA